VQEWSGGVAWCCGGGSSNGGGCAGEEEVERGRGREGGRGGECVFLPRRREKEEEADREWREGGRSSDELSSSGIGAAWGNGLGKTEEKGGDG